MQIKHSRELVYEHFTLSEIESLCTDLDIEYEDLSGSTRRAKANALSDYLFRRGQLLPFFSLLKHQRSRHDLSPYLHELIAQQFSSAEALASLFASLELPLRNFQGAEMHAWGGIAWRNDKAQKLQLYCQQNNQWTRLLQAVTAHKTDPIPLQTLQFLFPGADQAEPPPIIMKGSGESEPPPVLGQGRRWAVLVGVNEYDDAINYGDLQVCVKDAQAIHAALLRSGYEAERIRLLTDDGPEKPTRINILATLRAVAQATEPNDSLLFYYSGHGDAADGESYLLGKEGHAFVLEDSAVAISRVKEIMMAAPARAKAIILDACHSGVNVSKGAKGAAPMSPEFIRRVFEEAQGMVIMASCQQGEKSYEWRAKERSVFTHYLLEAMSGAADYNQKGFVSINDAGAHVVNYVKLWASQQKVSQTPTLESHISGDMILAHYQQESAEMGLK